VFALENTLAKMSNERKQELADMRRRLSKLPSLIATDECILHIIYGGALIDIAEQLGRIADAMEKDDGA
jgi:hypothetical protein